MVAFAEEEQQLEQAMLTIAAFLAGTSAVAADFGMLE